jgi:hypothetical protein
MDVQILGQYDFGNFTLLNALMGEEERINTAIHEYTHFGLSNQSVYGSILYCLNKLIIPQDNNADINKRKAVMDFFLSNTLKVQEGMAVFIEATYFMLGDSADYDLFISELRTGNKKYYDYVKPLCFILEYMKNEEYDSVLTVAHAVFQIAIKSMNASIFDFDGKLFATNKSIKKMISRQDFSKEYLPNKKFLTMIESCKNEKTYEEFCQSLFSYAKEEEDYSVEYYRDRFEKIKKFVLEIFEGSPNIEIYTNCLKQVNIKEVDPSSIFLQQLPTAFNEEYIQKNMKKIEYGLLKKKCKTIEYSTLFLLGELKHNISDLLIKMGVVNVPDIEETREILFFYSLRDKDVFGCMLEKNELHELVEQTDNRSVILTSYKNYNYENDCLPNNHRIEGSLYIYCDRTYSNAVTYIKQWAEREVYYRYMVYESMVVLLVKICETSLFMLPMTPIVAEEAEKDIQTNYKNMHPITEVEDEEFDSHIIKDEKTRDEIDTIINCLFFINLPVSCNE